MLRIQRHLRTMQDEMNTVICIYKVRYGFQIYRMSGPMPVLLAVAESYLIAEKPLIRGHHGKTPTKAKNSQRGNYRTLTFV